MKTTAILFASILLLITKNGSAQKISPLPLTPKFNTGIGLSNYYSGSGHGSVYNPFIHLRVGNSRFHAGMLIQKRRSNISGLQGSYEHLFNNSRGGRAQLFVFAHVSYHANGYLGKYSLKTENYCDRENLYDFENMQLKTLETYGGLGMDIKLSKHLVSSWSIGMGMYTSANKNTNYTTIYRDDAGPTSIVKWTLIYQFKKQNVFTNPLTLSRNEQISPISHR